MELKFMELKFHKKGHYRYLKRHYRAPYGAIRFKKKTCMLKRHYRAPYGAIRLKKKKTYMLKRHYRAPYGVIRLKKKTCRL